MDSEAWNKEDDVFLHLYFLANPLERGFAGLEDVLGVIEALDEELRPDRMWLARRSVKYSRKVLRQRLPDAYVDTHMSFQLSRSRAPESSLWLSAFEGDEDARFALKLVIRPFAFVREPGKEQERADRLISLVRALSARLPFSYGVGHSLTDFYLGRAPHEQRLRVPQRISETYWLNVYGPRMVEALGRQQLFSTPATLVEDLPNGAVLLLTRPTAADFASDEARLAQARALVHLRPDLELEPTLARLRQRSLAFQPIPLQFHQDVAEILREEVAFQGLMQRRQLVERFNQYQPPPVSEWLPTHSLSPPDVEEVRTSVDTYEGLYAEQLIALFHTDVPQVMAGTLEALPQLDWRLWHYGWGEDLSEAQRADLIPALGAWLGRYMVRMLGGRWKPRRNLEESAVIVGERAWLPFLRARHALQGREAPLDFSCTQFFREAQRHASPGVH